MKSSCGRDVFISFRSHLMVPFALSLSVFLVVLSPPVLKKK